VCVCAFVRFVPVCVRAGFRGVVVQEFVIFTVSAWLKQP